MGKRASREKKVFISLFAVLLLGVFAAGLWWVGTRGDRETRRELLAQIASLEALMSRSQKENVALLSVKYGIEPERLERILDAYLCSHDVVYRMKKGLSRAKAEGGEGGAGGIPISPDLPFGATLDNLSLQYQIPKERLAALIADYKILSRLDKEDALDRLLARGAKQSVVKGAFAGVRRLVGE